MKKLMLLVATMMVISMPLATAQKINEKTFIAKIEKADADSKDAKKSLKAATWLNRAKVYTEAIMEPTKPLFINLGEDMIQMMMGGEPLEVKDGAKGDNILVYEWVNIHTRNRKVVGWEQRKEIAPDMFDAANESLKKAYELDAKLAEKIKQIADQLINFYSQKGGAHIEILKYREGAEAYIAAATLQEIPIYSKVDPQYYFFAGQLMAFLGQEDATSFKDGQKYLEKAKDMGYADANGNIYYFLFHCYYGQKDIDKANITKAKDILLEGIAKYPKNERILDGLMSLYTSEDGVGDPRELVELIDKAIAENPDNVDLWFGRGRVFFKIKDYDECIVCFKKIDELKPNDYDTNFYLGYFLIAKGDNINREFNAKVESIQSQEEYEKERKKVVDAYMKAVPYFEKAHELKPDNLECAQSLKELCFRVRTEEGMMEKYNKYNADFKKLKGE